MTDKILYFLKNRSLLLCTVATVSQTGKPENALVGYAVTDKLQIIINTSYKTRKWNNIKENKYVSLVFGFGFDELNLQYEGIAELLDLENPEYTKSEEFFFSQNPDAKKYKSDTTRLIKITPLWLRLTDTTVNPPKIEEKTFK